ncbi:hypothetical protein DIPPA_23682 [Diplonema papillatum]|nr:hypothetical protein DIPPA_23682 [Diplonema papillatum]
MHNADTNNEIARLEKELAAVEGRTQLLKRESKAAQDALLEHQAAQTRLAAELKAQAAVLADAQQRLAQRAAAAATRETAADRKRRLEEQLEEVMRAGHALRAESVGPGNADDDRASKRKTATARRLSAVRTRWAAFKAQEEATGRSVTAVDSLPAEPPAAFAAEVNALRSSTRRWSHRVEADGLRARYPHAKLPAGLASVTYDFEPWLGTLPLTRGKPDVVISDVAINRKVELLRQLTPPPSAASVVRLVVPVLCEDESTHPFHRIRLLVAEMKSDGATHLLPFGGAVEAKDGDPSDGVTTLVATARRIVREITGVDLPSTLDTRPLLRTHYDNGATHTYLTTDFEKELPKVLDLKRAAKRAANVEVSPALVSLHRLVRPLEQPADGCRDDVDFGLLLACAALKHMLEVPRAASLLSVLTDRCVSMQAAVAANAQAKARQLPNGSPGCNGVADKPPEDLQLTVVEELDFAAVEPLTFLDCPETPAAPHSGMLTRAQLLQLLLRHVDGERASNDQLYFLLMTLGLDEQTECNYFAASTIKRIMAPDEQYSDNAPFDPPIKKQRNF